MWPPVYPPSNDEQFREYLSTIDFHSDSDADNMFARPMPVPGYQSYPAAPADTSAHATPVWTYVDWAEIHPQSYRPTMLLDFEDASDSEDDANLEDEPYPEDEPHSEHESDSEYESNSEDGSNLEHEPNSEDDAEFEYDSDYENERVIEKEPDANDMSAHATLPPRSRSSSPPLAPLLAEDFPPLRGTGLGKTTVLSQKRPRVASQPPVDVAATYPSSPLLDPGTSPRRDSGNSGSLKSGFTGDLSLAEMGPPPKRQRIPDIFPQMKQLPKPRAHFERTTDKCLTREEDVWQNVTQSYEGQGERLSDGARIPLFRYSPHYMGSFKTENTTLDASTSGMSPPHKRQRSTAVFPKSRQHTERGYSNHTAEADWQRYDQEPHQTIRKIRSMGERMFQEKGRLGVQSET